MKLRRARTLEEPCLQMLTSKGWTDLAPVCAALGQGRETWARDPLALLAAPPDVRAKVAEIAESHPPSEASSASVLLPFQPASFRDFMLFEGHAIAAARGMVRRFLPKLAPIVSAYERLVKKPFPALRPKALYYQQPIYYMGNHLAFLPDGAEIPWPSYSEVLDYELELGAVLVRPLRDASPAEAERAIGGFVLVNDISARDVQLAEMNCGFGPQKAKHFCNSMSAVLVSADEVLPRLCDLVGTVRINGRLVAEVNARGPAFSIAEAIAHASKGESLYPGELFATGTLPGGSGIENGHLPARGDEVELAIEGVGVLRNRYR